MARALRAGIVGCGPAGQAAAILLARLGWSVTIFERAPALGPVGAGLLLQPVVMEILGQLGVKDEILAAGTPIHALRGATSRNRVVLDLRYRDLDQASHGVGIHRGTLFQILQRRVEAENVPVLTGIDIQSSSQTAQSQRVLVDRLGDSHGPFDLIVAADGARSALRHGCGHVKRDRRYAWGALWFVAKLRSGLERHGLNPGTLVQVYRGTREMIGFLPSGLDPAGESQTVSVFWSVPAGRIDRIRREGIDRWRERAVDLAPNARALLGTITSMDDLIFAEYRDVIMKRCFSDSLVCIGDAAHAMSPQLGLGANLSLIDAWVLARCLAEHPVPEALPIFDAQRRAHVRFYQLASRRLTPFFQSSLSPLAWPRDMFMGPLCHFPPTRRVMLQSLAGVKTGLFSTLGSIPPGGQRPAAPLCSEH